MKSVFFLLVVLVAGGSCLQLGPDEAVSESLKVVTNVVDNAAWTITATSSAGEMPLSMCYSWLAPVTDAVVDDLSALWEKTCFNSETNFISCNATTCKLTVVPRYGLSYISFFNAGEDPITFTYTTAPTACGSPCDNIAPLDKPGILSTTETSYYTLTPPANSATTYLKGVSLDFMGATGHIYFFLAGIAPQNPSSADAVCQLETLEKTTCVIPAPPFNTLSADKNYAWSVHIVLDDGQTTVNFTSISFQQCDPSDRNCISVMNLDASKFDDGDYYLVPNPSVAQYFLLVPNGPLGLVDIVVSGLDGFKQADTAPAIWLQVDSLPKADSFLIYSDDAVANRVTVDLTDIAQNHTRVYLLIKNTNSKYAYGVWTPYNETSVCPEDCGGHGNCDTVLLICECDDGYNGLACDHDINNFETEYIILIAVGGLLVIAIIIGVPIYCWMNRRKDYEMVA